jgi:hypothetical protein
MSKTNWLNELRSLVLAGLVLGTAGALFQIVTLVFFNAPITVTTSPPDAAANVLSARIEVPEPTGKQIALYAATGLPTVVVVLTVLWLLFRLLSQARKADPFTPATVRGLRRLALVVIAGGSLAGLIEVFAQMELSATIPPGSSEGVWSVPLLWILLGAGFLAVAELVARGVAMREELDRVI